MTAKFIENLVYKYTFILVLLVGFIFLFASIIVSGKYSQILETIALTIITAGILTLIFDLASKQYLSEKYSEDIRKYTLEANGFSKSITKSGIIKIDEKFSSDHINQLIKKARKRVVILQTWLPHKTDLIPYLIDAANRGCEVHLLLLNNTPPTLAEYRAKTLGKKQKSYVSTEIEVTLVNIKSHWQEKGRPSTFKVCLYSVIPSIFAYMIDNKLIFGPFLAETYGINGLSFEVNGKKGYIAKYITSHYETILNKYSEEYELTD